MSSLNVVELYDYLHSIPEMGYEEEKTSAFLAGQLEKLGYQVRRGIAKTGVVGEIKGSEPGPVVIVRADMDALRFTDDQGNYYFKHACGHDSHCSIVLAAAAEAAGKIKKGTLRILFQPAEELGTGAQSVIKEGIFEDADIAIGLHNRPITELPEGTMTPAVKHGSTCFVTVKLTGHGSHSARPHMGINAVDAAAMIVNGINSIKMDPTKSWSCKCTGLRGGFVSCNLIPESAEMIFDVRAESNKLMDELLKKARRIISGVAEAMDVKAELGTLSGIVPAAELDDELTAEIKEIMEDVVGKDKVMPVVSNPGGEDFHFYTQHYPKLRAAFFGVGAGAAPGLHAKDMELNKYALPPAVEILSRMISRLLG